ncbi:hypothetical protein ACSSS7_000583 [Eimeria intestinalis]
MTHHMERLSWARPPLLSLLPLLSFTCTSPNCCWSSSSSKSISNSQSSSSSSELRSAFLRPHGTQQAAPKKGQSPAAAAAFDAALVLLCRATRLRQATLLQCRPTVPLLPQQQQQQQQQEQQQQHAPSSEPRSRWRSQARSDAAAPPQSPAAAAAAAAAGAAAATAEAANESF